MCCFKFCYLTYFLLFIPSLVNSQVKSLMPSATLGFEVGFYNYNDEELSSILGEFGGTTRLSLGLLWQPNDYVWLGFESGLNLYQVSHSVPIFWNAHGYKSRNGYDTLAVSNLHLTKKLVFIAKGGAAYSEYKYKLYGIEYWTEEPYSYKGAIQSWRPKATAGLGYNFNEYISVNFTVNNEFGNDRVTTTLVGIQYRL